MWYDEAIADVVEPVTLVEAKAQCRVDYGDEDDKLKLLISAARGHAEKYCAQSFAAATLTAKVTDWCDLRSLPTRPVRSAALTYTDINGATQTVPPESYAVAERAITLLSGAFWPQRQPGSPVVVTLAIGECPPEVKQAILLRIEDLHVARGSQPDGAWSAFDSLLCNHRY